MINRMTMKRHSLFVLLLILATLVCSVLAIGQETPDKKPLPGIISETQPAPQASAASANEGDHLLWRITGATIFIVIVFGGLIGYMFYLQNKFFQGCREDKQMSVFFNSPAGLPVGTVRAIIALIIITVSLALVVLSVFKAGVGNFPDMLVGILGTVLGFYFGSRSAVTGDEAAQEQIKQLKTQRDDAVTKQDTAQSETIVSKIKDGVAMSKTALQFLPEAERTKYGGYLTKLEQGLGVVDSFTKAGDLKQAGAKAAEIYEEYKQGNPAQGAFNDAVKAFGQVLGNSVPAIALASTVVILCTKLAGAVYQKWKARILQAPFSPAIISLKVADANTGFTIINSSPLFKKAFMKELEANDRPFIESTLILFEQTDVETFFSKYRDRFESREQFESGLSEFRKTAADLQLEGDIPSALLADAGGYKKFTEAIDKIGADPEAKASLDKLFIVTENLHKSGQPVLNILDQAKSEVQS